MLPWIYDFLFYSAGFDLLLSAFILIFKLSLIHQEEPFQVMFYCFPLTCTSYFFSAFPCFFWHKLIFPAPQEYCIFCTSALESGISLRNTYSFFGESCLETNTQHQTCSLLIEVLLLLHPLSGHKQGINACILTHLHMYNVMHTHARDIYTLLCTFIFTSLSIKNTEFTLISSILIQSNRVHSSFLPLNPFSDSDKSDFHDIYYINNLITLISCSQSPISTAIPSPKLVPPSLTRALTFRVVLPPCTHSLYPAWAPGPYVELYPLHESGPLPSQALPLWAGLCIHFPQYAQGLKTCTTSSSHGPSSSLIFLGH